MQLIGMLDSPYVRRVAISLRVLGLAFDLDQVSVFRPFRPLRRHQSRSEGA
jgi:glutathione S-transferase